MKQQLELLLCGNLLGTLWKHLLQIKAVIQ
jgi:hypothetical protein